VIAQIITRLPTFKDLGSNAAILVLFINIRGARQNEELMRGSSLSLYSGAAGQFHCYHLGWEQYPRFYIRASGCRCRRPYLRRRVTRGQVKCLPQGRKFDKSAGARGYRRFWISMSRSLPRGALFHSDCTGSAIGLALDGSFQPGAVAAGGNRGSGTTASISWRQYLGNKKHSSQSCQLTFSTSSLPE